MFDKITKLLGRLKFSDYNSYNPDITISFREFRQWVQSLEPGSDLGNPSDSTLCPMVKFLEFKYPNQRVAAYVTHISINGAYMPHNDQHLSNFICKAIELVDHKNIIPRSLTREDAIWLIHNTSKNWNYIPYNRLNKYLDKLEAGLLCPTL